MTSPSADLTASWQEASLQCFHYYKTLADRAIAQSSDDALQRAIDPNTNSIAVIVQHLAGNLESRWTDFLTADGEKPGRDRDAEFTPRDASREELLASWERGWGRFFDSLTALTAEDFGRTVAIRGESHSVPLAIQRSLTHVAYHVGQIVQLARHWAGSDWTTLTIPRGGSTAHNAAVWGTDDYARRTEG